MAQVVQMAQVAQPIPGQQQMVMVPAQQQMMVPAQQQMMVPAQQQVVPQPARVVGVGGGEPEKKKQILGAMALTWFFGLLACMLPIASMDMGGG